MRPLYHTIGKTLEVLKWPISLLSLASAPASVTCLWSELAGLFNSGAAGLRFLVGLAGYLIAWRLLFRRRGFGSLFTTFLHELTHALMAWLTLNRVRGLKVTWSRGGHVVISGHPHWLISLAPYFVPTLSLLLISVVSAAEWVSGGPLISALWLEVLMGASLGLFWGALWIDLSVQQPDIQAAGRLCALCFLPGAACLSSAAVVAVGHAAHRGALHALAALGARWWGSLEALLG